MARTPSKPAPKAAATNSGETSAAAVIPAVRFEPLQFAKLDGWEADDHLAALKAFALSCDRVLHAVRVGARIGPSGPSVAQVRTCEEAVRLLARGASRKSARSFFEREFVPHRVVHDGTDGLLTGYYEPVIAGSRVRDATYTEPILRRPADLMNLVGEAERGAKAHQLTHARRNGDGWEPYATRREIEEGALAGQGLELLYLRDPVDVFFMQVQGSGRIALPDGTHVRVTYDGKNGHPYTSIGRYLIDAGLFPADRMSLQALKRWLRANPKRMREVLWQNASYVFFRELAGDEANAPRGALEIALTPGRSLAVDTRFHVLGTPVWVASPALTHATARDGGFRRLMVAQDVGSAIRGPERGDIYFGSGDKAGSLAGITKHRGNFLVLLPRPHDGAGTIIETSAPRGRSRQAQQ